MAGDNFDLEDSGFDDFSFDDPGFDFDITKDDRKPATKFTTSFAKGFADSVKSPTFYRDLVDKSLPREYGEALSDLDRAADYASGLYNSTAKTLQPAIKDLRRGLRSAVSKDSKVIPSFIKDWIYEEEYEYNNAKLSEEEQRRAEANLAIASIFKTQVENDAEQNAKTNAREEFSLAQRLATDKRQDNLLASIRRNTAYLVSYNNEVASPFQRKQLEISFRHLGVAQDTLVQIREMGVKTIGVLDEIVKNTSLPDAVKMSRKDVVKANVREKYLTPVSDMATGLLNNATSRIFGNISGFVKKKVGDFRMAYDTGSGFMDMASMVDPYELIGGLAGSQFGAGALNDVIANKLLHKYKDSDKIRGGAARLDALRNNIVPRLFDWAESHPGYGTTFTEDINNLFSKNWKAGVSGMFGKLGSEVIGSREPRLDLSSDYIAQANEAVPHTSAERRSIIEVIPGYLARILQAQRQMSDPSAPLTKWDHEKGDFIDDTVNRGIIQRRIKESGGVNGIRDMLDSAVDKLGAKGVLSDDAIDALRKQLLRNSNEHRGFNVQRMSDAKSYHSSVDDSTREELANFFKTKFGAGEKRALGTRIDLDELEQSISATTQRLNKTLPELIKEVEHQLVLGNGPELEKLGLVRFERRSWRLNLDGIYKLMDSLLEAQPLHAENSYRKVYDDPNGFSATFGDMFEGVKGEAKGGARSAKAWLRLMRRKVKGTDYAKAASDAVDNARNTDYGKRAEEMYGTAKDKASDAAREARVRARWAARKGKRTLLDALKKSKGIKTESISNAVEAIKNGNFEEGMQILSSITEQAAEAKGSGFNAFSRRATEITEREAKRRNSVLGKASMFLQMGKGNIVDKLRGSKASVTDSVKSAQDYLSSLSKEDLEQAIDKAEETLNEHFGNAKREVVDRAKRVQDVVEGNEHYQAAKRFGEGQFEKAKAFGAKSKDRLTSAFERVSKVLEHFDPEDIRNKLKDRFAKQSEDNDKGLSNNKDVVDLLRQILDVNQQERELLASMDGRLSEGIKTVDVNEVIKELHASGYKGGIRDGLHRAAGKILSGGGSLVQGAAWMYKHTLGGLGRLAGGTLKLAGSAMGTLASMLPKFNRYGDVYVKGERRPRLFARGFKNGDYFDQKSGKPIKNFKDIKEGMIIVDKDNNVLIDERDIAKGLYDARGQGFLTRAMNWMGKTYGAFFSPFTALAKFASKTIGSITDSLYAPKDVYVVGTESPALLGKVMAGGGYYSVRTGKPIKSFKDIDGDISDEDGEIVLTKADIRKGLVDRRGNKLKTFGDRLVDIGSSITGAAWKAAKWGMKQVAGIYKFGWGVIRKAGKFVYRGLGLEKAESVDEVTALATKSSAETLQEILRLLDERLPQPRRRKLGDTDGDGDVENSAEDILQRRKTAKAEKAKEEAEEKATEGKTGKGFMDSLKRMFGLGGAAEAAEGGGDDGDTTIIGGGDGGDGKGKGKGKTPKGKGGKPKVPKGFWGKTKALGSKVGGKLVRFGGKLLPFVPLAVAMAESGGAALASAGSVVAAGAAGLLSAVAAVLSSPVVLIGGAIALAGAGAYFGYKYLTKNKSGPFSDLRTLQYGVKPDDKVQAVKVMGLEKAVFEHSSYDKRTGKVSFDITAPFLKEVMLQFGVDLNRRDEVDAFITWFDYRFKQVFVKHRVALEAIDSGSEFSDVESFSADDKRKYLAQVTFPTNDSPYTIMQSPFGQLPLKVKPSDIVSYINDLKMKIMEDNKERETQKYRDVQVPVPIAPGAPGFMPLPSTLRVDRAGKPLNAQNGAAFTGTANFTVPHRDLQTIAVDLGSFNMKRAGLTALDCVRYKAYGLGEMDESKVATLRELERMVFKEVVVGANGAAKLVTDAKDYFAVLGASFGVSDNDVENKANWIKWFYDRFAPVALAYYTSVKMLSPNTNPASDIGTLPGEIALKVAQAIVTAKTSGFMFTRSVWTVKESPWPNFILTNDVTVTNGNINALKQNASIRKSLDVTAADKPEGGTPPLLARKPISQVVKDRMATGENLPTSGNDDYYEAIAESRKSQKNDAVGRTSDRYHSSTYIMPLSGRISSVFGPRNDPRSGKPEDHKGIDIAAPNGTPIRAAADGVIIRREFSESYGNVIYIKHGDGKTTRYAHMSHFQPGYGVGSSVKQGDIIGYVGNTGWSAGNHLHFEIRDSDSANAKPLDPLKIFKRDPQVARTVDTLAAETAAVKKEQADVSQAKTPPIEGKDTIASTALGKATETEGQDAAPPANPLYNRNGPESASEVMSRLNTVSNSNIDKIREQAQRATKSAAIRDAEVSNQTSATMVSIANLNKLQLDKLSDIHEVLRRIEMGQSKAAVAKQQEANTNAATQPTPTRSAVPGRAESLPPPVMSLQRTPK